MYRTTGPDLELLRVRVKHMGTEPVSPRKADQIALLPLRRAPNPALQSPLEADCYQDISDNPRRIKKLAHSAHHNFKKTSHLSPRSYRGGWGGYPAGTAPVSVSTFAHFLRSYPARDSANRTDSVRSPNLSPFEALIWGQRGSGIPPVEFFSRPLWARSIRCARARGSAGRVPADRWCGTIRPA